MLRAVEPAEAVRRGSVIIQQRYIEWELFHEEIFYIRILKKAMMQQKFQNVSNYSSHKLLQKCTSLPAFSDSTNSSNHSIESLDDQHRKQAIKWILNFHKKVEKDTQYLAIAILNKLSFPLHDDNTEKVAIACLLIASKMNEIYPPKISHLTAKCSRFVHRDDIIELEGSLLASLGFDVAIDQTVYTYMHRILGCLYGEKLEECEKLYRMVACHKEIYQFGDELAAYAIIYLIIPDFIRKMKLRENHKIKTLAIKIYNIYTETKQQYEREKENRNRMC